MDPGRAEPGTQDARREDGRRAGISITSRDGLACHRRRQSGGRPGCRTPNILILRIRCTYMSTTEKPRLLPLRDVAERLSVSRATIYRMTRDGRLPCLQLGGRGAPLRVDEAELDEWLHGDARTEADDR